MRQKGFAPILIILVIAILGVVGYFAYKNYSVNSQSLTVPPFTFSNVPSQPH
jgi:Tfp pilus assembly protein PilE